MSIIEPPVNPDPNPIDPDVPDRPEPEPQPEEQQLGEGGKKALDAERRARQTADRNRARIEKERDDLAARITELEGQTRSESDKALDKAVRDAEARVRNEMAAQTNARVIRAQVLAQAAGKLHNPNDAVLFLNFEEFAVDENGEADETAIASAMDALLDERPYLAKTTGSKFIDVDQGIQSSPTEDIQPGLDRLAHAYSNSPQAKRK